MKLLSEPQEIFCDMEIIFSSLLKKWHNIGTFEILTLEEDVVACLFKEEGFKSFYSL